MQSSRTGVWRKGALEGSTTQEKFYNSDYYLGLKTDTIFPALKLTQYCYIYNYVFFLKTGNLKGYTLSNPSTVCIKLMQVGGGWV